MKIVKNIVERLKICWMVLTSPTYYTFFISKRSKKYPLGRVRGAYIGNLNEFYTDIIIEFLNDIKNKEK